MNFLTICSKILQEVIQRYYKKLSKKKMEIFQEKEILQENHSFWIKEDYAEISAVIVEEINWFHAEFPAES